MKKNIKFWVVAAVSITCLSLSGCQKSVTETTTAGVEDATRATTEAATTAAETTAESTEESSSNGDKKSALYKSDVVYIANDRDPDALAYFPDAPKVTESGQEFNHFTCFYLAQEFPADWESYDEPLTNNTTFLNYSIDMKETSLPEYGIESIIIFKALLDESSKVVVTDSEGYDCTPKEGGDYYNDCLKGVIINDSALWQNRARFCPDDVNMPESVPLYSIANATGSFITWKLPVTFDTISNTDELFSLFWNHLGEKEYPHTDDKEQFTTTISGKTAYYMPVRFLEISQDNTKKVTDSAFFMVIIDNNTAYCYSVEMGGNDEVGYELGNLFGYFSLMKTLKFKGAD